MTQGGAAAGEPSPFMREALEEAQAVLGTTSPNPAVGAVVVRDGRIVGRGATQPPGGPHAEVVALRDAGDRARGATLYVTLEPCTTQGRTPPCTDAVLAAGVEEVVVAYGDADRNVDGDGVRTLRAANVTVRTGDGAAAAALHYEAYSHHRRTGRPFVTAKYAASLDGKIAATSGDSRWVSSAETRAEAHRNRTLIDAILVGVDTIVLDNPQLTARPDGSSEGAHQPLRIVLDSRGRLPLAANVLGNQALAATLVATTMRSPQAWRDEIVAAGARLEVFQPQAERVPLLELLQRLGEQGIVSLLVEGGGRVHGSFFDQHLVNKVYAVIAPMIIGGDAASAVVGRGAERMKDVVRLRQMSVARLGDDILVTGYPIGIPPSANVTTRLAGTADSEGYLELVEDPGERLALEARIRAAIAGSSEEAQVWVAVQAPAPPDAAPRIVGGVVLRFRDREWPERADGRHRAGLQQLHVAAEWRGHGLANRLIETVEAAAEGRGFGALTALPAEVIGQAGQETDASGFTPDDWRSRGFRYYRRTLAGTALRMKPLAPDPELQAARLMSESD